MNLEADGGRRLVVVTGGSSGIGLACADRFRRDGADVRIADVQDPEHHVDVSDEAALRRSSRATWRKVFAVNLDGAFLCLRAAARRMAAAGGGVVVNVSSVVADALSIPQVRAAVQERTAIGDARGAPSDVAELVAFLASDRARWITGTTVAVDGGQSLLGFPDIAAIAAQATGDDSRS